MKLKASIPKKSASLLILKPALKSKISFFDYDLLVLQRNQKMAFGSALVFPGGKVEPVLDEDYRSKYSLKSQLYSSVLRQTFQETGLFFANRPILESEKMERLSKIKIQYIANVFNKISTAKQRSFNQISELLSPSTQFLPFIRMVTIPLLKHRYDTTFFVHVLQSYRNLNFFKYAEHDKYMTDLENIVHCDHQYINFRWMNPAQILNQHFQKKAFIAPPQFIMLNILLKFKKSQQFKEYLQKKNGEADLKNRNYDLGPNIISLVPNQGSQRQIYPYAATLLGDKQFPYERIYQNQSCQYLKEEIRQWLQLTKSSKNENVNRFLFKESKQFFNSEFDVVCNFNESVIKEMKGWRNLKQQLSSLIV